LFFVLPSDFGLSSVSTIRRMKFPIFSVKTSFDLKIILEK